MTDRYHLLRRMDFYLVTDSSLSKRGTFHDVEQALEAGCAVVQYREKEKSTRRMVEEAGRLRELCAGRAVFLVNDRIDVALAADADGVHIGQDDMPFGTARRLLGPDRIIGLTVHDVPEALEAERLGADYVGLSPIFATSTKKDAGCACGVEMISEVRRQIRIPIVVIGGISKANVADTIRAGADAAVAISAVVCARDVAVEVREFRKIILGARGIAV
ncbi:MAG: thiamine phosphate synthase [Candidatus Latescibacterota bacterium]